MKWRSTTALLAWCLAAAGGPSVAADRVWAAGVIVAVPDTPRPSAADEGLLRQTELLLARLLAPTVVRAQQTVEGEGLRVWSAPSWAELPSAERERDLAQLRRLWGERLRVELAQARPGAVTPNRARAPLGREPESPWAAPRAVVGRLAVALPDQARLFDGAARRSGTVIEAAQTPSPPAPQLPGEPPGYETATPASPRRAFSRTAPYRDLIQESSGRFDVDPALIEAVILVESSHPRSVSPQGALGLMQLMPETARRLGVKRPFDPAQNIPGGTRYLRELLDRFNGDVVLALAAYNAGPNLRALAAGRIPSIRETVHYVTRVLHRYALLTGGEMIDLPGRLTDKGKRWHTTETLRLARAWGPLPGHPVVAATILPGTALVASDRPALRP